MINEIQPIQTENKKRICNFHKANPGKQYPGCTCSVGYCGKVVDLTKRKNEKELELRRKATKRLLEYADKLGW